MELGSTLQHCRVPNMLKWIWSESGRVINNIINLYPSQSQSNWFHCHKNQTPFASWKNRNKRLSGQFPFLNVSFSSQWHQSAKWWPPQYRHFHNPLLLGLTVSSQTSLAFTPWTPMFQDYPRWSSASWTWRTTGSTGRYLAPYTLATLTNSLHSNVIFLAICILNVQTGQRWREKPRGSSSATIRRCSNGWRRRSTFAPAAANSRSTSLRARPSSAALSECKAASRGSPPGCVDCLLRDFSGISETASRRLWTSESQAHRWQGGGGYLVLL